MARPKFQHYGHLMVSKGVSRDQISMEPCFFFSVLWFCGSGVEAYRRRCTGWQRAECRGAGQWPTSATNTTRVNLCNREKGVCSVTYVFEVLPRRRDILQLYKPLESPHTVHSVHHAEHAAIPWRSIDHVDVFAQQTNFFHRKYQFSNDRHSDCPDTAQRNAFVDWNFPTGWLFGLLEQLDGRSRIGPLRWFSLRLLVRLLGTGFSLLGHVHQKFYGPRKKATVWVLDIKLLLLGTRFRLPNFPPRHG